VETSGNAVFILHYHAYDRSPSRNTVPGYVLPRRVGGVYSFLRQSVHSLHAVGKKSALLHAQGKENRTKCVSTVPTTSFCLQ